MGGRWREKREAKLSLEKEASRTDPGLRCSPLGRYPTEILVDFGLACEEKTKIKIIGGQSSPIKHAV